MLLFSGAQGAKSECQGKHIYCKCHRCAGGVFHVCRCVNKKRDIKKESVSKEIWRSSEEERRT